MLINVSNYLLFVVPCSIGHYYSNEECISCPKGTYQDTIGNYENEKEATKP
jgi:hypothetical protein